MELNTLYFFTASIPGWKHLLKPGRYKDMVIKSLKYLSEKKKIAVYGFVIMPNHIHLIWELLAKNGKELPHASMMKYMAHAFLQSLREHHPKALPHFEVDKAARKHQFWQRDCLPIGLYTPEVAYQQLEYMHNNPCQGKWLLAISPLQ